MALSHQLRMKELYTNRNSVRNDFFRDAFSAVLQDGADVKIATAFFTDSAVIQELATDARQTVRLVVRLGFPTSPGALKKALSLPNVQVRYFSSHSFHPKLYIFGDEAAYVGSANLTGSALMTNQEIMIRLDPSDLRFDELLALFAEYWDQASVLDTEKLKEYERIWSAHTKAINEINKVDADVAAKIGVVEFNNITRGSGKRGAAKDSIFLEEYAKAFQETVSAYACIEDIYKNFDRRSNEVPLRLEIDSFFGFLRVKHAVGDKWLETPIGWNESRRQETESYIREWLSTDWLHFDNDIVAVNYPRITNVFGSAEKLQAASAEQIASALTALHSFHDRLRYYKGGIETLKREFIEGNGEEKIKRSLAHLLYGDKTIHRRMADLIFDTSYKLENFGRANVQELVGWVNREDLPVINGRTTKALRFLGFDVKQL